MDQELAKRLNQLNQQNEKLTEAEKLALQLDAHKKVLYSQLLIKLIDAEGSLGMKEAQVYASQEWQDFIGGLVDVESTKNKEKRRWEILSNAFIAELNTYKREGKMIDKEGHS